MAYRDVNTPLVRPQIQLRFVKRNVRRAGAYQCLVVSADASRGELLERAASEGGWRTSTCDNAASALTYLDRSVVQLALVDLEHQQSAAFRPVIERLTGTTGLLLIVCGNEGVADEELWVRQQGAWLYLPGVTEGSNLSLLCSEARQLAERLGRSNNAVRGPAVAVSRRNSQS